MVCDIMSSQWDVEVEILGSPLGLVHSYGWHEAFPKIFGKDK